jgi:four helix bundle protein
MRVKRFEDLAVWQKARDLSVLVYRPSSEGPFARDWGLRDQVRRAAVSTMSNIAEGFSRYSRAELRQFLSIARGSATEVQSQLLFGPGTPIYHRTRTQDVERAVR